MEVYTALVTPFNSDLSIDFKSLDKLTDKLIDEGERNFLLLGTTGECSLLKLEERKNLISYFLNRNKDVRVMVGICSNNTIDVIRQIEELRLFKDIYAFLINVPYYLNPNQRGIFKHFDMICSSTSNNIMIYNIPKRTNVSIDVETIIKLKKKHNNLIGIKQCGNTDCIKRLKELDDFNVYIGDDHMLLEGLKEGADGIISVCSHIDYKLIHHICMEKKVEDDFVLKQLCKTMFIEPSPAPLKYVLSQLGYIENKLRSPFCVVDKESEKLLDRVVDIYKKDLKEL